MSAKGECATRCGEGCVRVDERGARPVLVRLRRADAATVERMAGVCGLCVYSKTTRFSDESSCPSGGVVDDHRLLCGEPDLYWEEVDPLEVDFRRALGKDAPRILR